ncbi:sulfatase [Tundrisphaera sp. TA3]|uniref:sulfatase n=1 Tax=Tundrisphaera sp. TA3 TaxID=3435775 RepID=UPI003EBD47C5
MLFYASACRGGSPPAPAPDRPNIVLIFADDLGWRDVASNSDGFIETPNLDRLRSQGMSFTSAYAGAANCAPSRACLLSGQYTPRHGVYAVGDTDRGPKDKFRLAPVPNAQGLRSDIVTVAEALKGQGYATGHFGKWHLGSDARGTGPKSQGFDVSPPELVPARDGGDDDDEDEKPGPSRKGARKEAAKGANPDPKRTVSITRAACDFIETNKDRPFFAYLAHHAIHTQLQAKESTLARFRAKADATNVPHVAALYAACTYDLDASVGVLLKKLEDLGLERNTLVIFTSDNGGTPASINEPLRGAKGAYYEAGIREPFFARWPGRIAPGSRCDVPIINQDLYPTFVAAAGGTPAPALDGANLLPLFEGKGTIDRTSIFWHFPGYLDKPVPRGRDPLFRTRPVTVIRKGDWKLFLYHEEWVLDGGRDALATNHAVELYRVGQDIGEREDLAQKETARRDELLGDLLGWIKSTDARLATRK